MNNTIQGLVMIMFPATIPILCACGTVSLYRQYKANQKINVRLQHSNHYADQGFVISDSRQIETCYNSLPTNLPIDYNNKEIVKTYMEQLERSIGKDIRIARNNFSTLKVIKSDEIKKTGVTGCYNGSENIIKYAKNTKSILGHEMLHMASYMYNRQKDIHYHGFMQQKGDTIICTGLNEGFTELLNSRLFTNGQILAYPRLVRIVKLLERFFPNPQVISHYYFTCNLPAFLQQLGKFCTQTELKEIIQGLDKLYELSYVPESIAAITLETKLSKMIYNIYERNFGTDPNRVESFKQQAGENKLTALALSRKKTTLVRNNTFNRIKTSVQNGLQKVKKLFKVNQQQPQHAYSR